MITKARQHWRVVAQHSGRDAGLVAICETKAEAQAKAQAARARGTSCIVRRYREHHKRSDAPDLGPGAFAFLSGLAR